MFRFHALVLVAVLLLQTVRALGAPMSEQEVAQDRAHFSALGATDVADPRATLEDIDDLELRLDRAEARATDSGRAILQKGRAMIKDGIIVTGSCWDYIHAVYNNAGYPTKNRTTPFKSKKAGPYAHPSDVQPGDWLYYINHSFGDVEHSGIFVDWYDFASKEAVILSYAGQNLRSPGRYKLYDLSHIYHVIRPKGSAAEPSGFERIQSKLQNIDASPHE